MIYRKRDQGQDEKTTDEGHRTQYHECQEEWDASNKGRWIRKYINDGHSGALEI